MGLYLGPDRPALGYGTVFLVVAIGWDYLTTVYRLTIAGDSLELAWPLRRRKLNRSDVTSASLSDDIDEHENRTSRVTLKLTHPDRVIQLRALGTPAMDLERAIVAWMKNVA